MRWRRSRAPSPTPGSSMADIDGLATYPELPATGHAEVDGITIVSVNCMMAMLKLPNLTWHIQVGSGQHRRRRAAGRQRAARRRVQVRRGLAGDAQPARAPTRTCPARMRAGRDAVHRAVRLRRSGPGHGGRVHALARDATTRTARRWSTLAVTQRKHTQHEPARLLLRHAADARGLLRLAHGRVSVLPLRLRHPGAGGGRHRADDRRAGARPEADARLSRRLRSAAALRGGRPHRQPRRLHGGRRAARRSSPGSAPASARRTSTSRRSTTASRPR